MEDNRHSVPGGKQLMSNPIRLIRQPGGRRKVGDCTVDCACSGMCNNNGPADSVAVTLGGFSDSCAGLNGTFTLANTGSCGCGWRLDTTLNGNPITIQFNFVFSFDGSGNLISESAVCVVSDGSGAQYRWTYNLTGGKGQVDCASFSFTMTPDSSLTPTLGCANTTGTCSVAASGPGTCSKGGKPCCCGGQPPPPCFHVCITDPDSPCNTSGIDVRLCLSSTNPLTYTGSGKDLSGNTITATLTYDPAAPSWTLTYSCNGGPAHSFTFTPANGWGKKDGAIFLQGADGSISIKLGPGAQCLPKPNCQCCLASGFSLNYDVDLGAGGWFAPPVNGIAPFCADIKGVYTLSYVGGGSNFADACETWGYNPQFYDQYCAANFCRVAILLYLRQNPCRWHVLIDFDCQQQVPQTMVEYESDPIDPSDCLSPIILNKVSEVFNVGPCSNVICNGTMPGTISIAAVI